MSDKVNKIVDFVFEKLPFLESRRESLQPTLDFLTERPFRLYMALGLPTLGFLLTLFNLLFGRKKVGAVHSCELSLHARMRLMPASSLQA